MSRIYLHTIAYNAEKTIHRCVASILNQTYKGRIDWYILDNGSTDQTWSILRSYAQKYDFIHVFHFNKNCTPQCEEEHKLWNQFCKRIQLDIADDDFYCTLDSDDEYMPDFFEKMMEFINRYDLDIAVAGTTYIDAESYKIIAIRNLSQTLILDNPKAFSNHFATYHAYMRPVWGKLYKGFTLKNYIRNEKLAYGSDTWFVFHTLRQAARVGIMNEALYKYYESTKSVSYVYDEKRINSDRILDNDAHDFLLSKCGSVSKQNDEFLFMVYISALRDTLGVTLRAQISLTEKLIVIYDIFSCENTRRFISWYDYIDGKKRLLYAVSDWIFAQIKNVTPHDIEIVGKILYAMYPMYLRSIKQELLDYLLLKFPELIDYLLKEEYSQILGWLCTWFKVHKQDDLLLTELEIFIYNAAGKPDYEIFMYYMEIKERRPFCFDKLAVDTRIRELTSKYSLLQNISAGLSTNFSHTVYHIMKEDYAAALEAFISVPQSIEISDDDAESYILLGQNLSAITDNAGVYIYYKKMWISYLINCSNTEEARKEIDEFEQLMPDDEDFIDLKKKLSLK